MELLDVVIIGASAAGVSAAVYAKRRGLKFKLISKDFGGEVATSGNIENWLGINKTMGLNLANSFLEQLKYNEVDFELEKEVIDVKKENNIFKVYIKNSQEPQELSSKSLIIASGSRPRPLNVPGEKNFYKRGVSFCTVCDGPVYKGKNVAIIGGGNSALEAALMMAELSPEVYVINKNSFFKGDEVLIKNLESKKNVKIFYNSLVTEIVGDKFVDSLKFKNTQSNIEDTIKISGIFVHIGMLPNSEFINIVEKNQFGEIKINRLCETSQAGIFAGGDVTDMPFRQINIASGLGTIAALSSVSYLNKH